MAQRFYRAIAYQAPGDGPDDGWDVIFPDFPGCVAQGASVGEAMSAAVEALALHVEGMIAEGETLPEPSAVDAKEGWATEIAMQNPVTALLPTEVPGKSVRLNITMDTALVERLDAAAAREGTSRSGFLAQAVREKLLKEREAV
jgi:predicted RNase H-like HicB family nuclease